MNITAAQNQVFNAGHTSALGFKYESFASVSASISLSGSYLDLKGSSSLGGDSLSVSDSARELSQRLRDIDVFKVIFPDSDPRRKAKTLDEVESDFLGDFSAFADSWRNLASLVGLGPDQSFTLGLDGVGGLNIEGGAAAGQLGKFFQEHPESVSRFAVMAARAALVDAADSVAGFREDYETDPFAAVKDHIGSLKELLLGFRVQTSGLETAYGFQRDFGLEISASASVSSSLSGGALPGLSEKA